MPAAKANGLKRCLLEFDMQHQVLQLRELGEGSQAAYLMLVTKQDAQPAKAGA